MSAVRRLDRWVGRVDSWFFDPAPIAPLSLARIGVGGTLFLHALSRLPEFDLLYGTGGAAWSVPWRAFVARFLAADVGLLPLSVVTGLMRLTPEAREAVLGALYAALLATSAAFAVGLFTRLAGWLALALHVLFVAVHPLAHYGWATMAAPFAAYIAMSRSGERFSVDAWRRRRELAPSDGLAPAWPLRLLQIHVVVMYFHTGFARIDDPSWLRGEALFEALARSLFTRFDLNLAALGPLLTPFSYAVFALEPAACVLLWIPRARTACALALLAMHAVLEVSTNVGWWNVIMIAGLLTFLPARWFAPSGASASIPAS